MVQISYWIGINQNETDPTPEEISNYKSFIDSHFSTKMKATLTCDSSHVLSQDMNSIMSFIYYTKCDESNKENIFHIDLTLDRKTKCSNIYRLKLGAKRRRRRKQQLSINKYCMYRAVLVFICFCFSKVSVGGFNTQSSKMKFLDEHYRLCEYTG